MKPTLLILAAGMGSRYGGLKQMDGLGPNEETIIDYSIYDAIQAGFGKVVFVIRESFQENFKKIFDQKLAGKIDVAYVTQELDKVPAGISTHPDRQKPWGTGHAMLVAKEVIKEPFAVINADDFYGKEGFADAYSYLTKGEETKECAIIAYELSKTLSDNGTVSRGVCITNANGMLAQINERTDILRKEEGHIAWKDSEDNWHELEENTPVSMNFWGFSPDFFNDLEARFADFLKEQGMELKSEFYIPFAVDELMKESKIKAKVIQTEANWFGVTYSADRPDAVQKLNKLIEQGVYPSNLWKV